MEMGKGRRQEMGEREDKKRRIEGKPKSKDGERGKLKDKGTRYDNGNDVRTEKQCKEGLASKANSGRQEMRMQS